MVALMQSDLMLVKDHGLNLWEPQKLPNNRIELGDGYWDSKNPRDYDKNSVKAKK